MPSIADADMRDHMASRGPTNDATNPVEVIEADRDEAKALMQRVRGYGVELPNDGHFAIQAFARHRIASRATDKTLAAELRKRADALLISDEMPDSAALYSLSIRILTSLEGQG